MTQEKFRYLKKLRHLFGSIGNKFKQKYGNTPNRRDTLKVEFVTVTLPTGASYYLDATAPKEDIYIAAVRSGGTNDTTWQFFIKWVASGNIIFDLGANIGVFTIPAAVIGAKVHAFELFESNARKILASIKKNDLTNVSVILGAIWDRSGCVGVAGYSAWGTVYHKSMLSMATIVIDDYVHQADIGHVDFMKIDIEGSELAGLRGSNALIERDHPDIIIECNAVTCGNAGYSLRDILSYLEERKYIIYRLYNGRLCPWNAFKIQEIIYADYFATVKNPEYIKHRAGWDIVDLADDEIIRNILAQEYCNDLHKNYVLMINGYLSARVRADQGVRSLLERWNGIANEQTISILKTGAL